MSRPPLCFDHANSVWWRDVNNKSDLNPQALIYVTAAYIPVKRTQR
jgi:hypothetical protein